MSCLFPSCLSIASSSLSLALSSSRVTGTSKRVSGGSVVLGQNLESATRCPAYREIKDHAGKERRGREMKTSSGEEGTEEGNERSVSDRDEDGEKKDGERVPRFLRETQERVEGSLCVRLQRIR